ncbi:MAG: Mur ligase family protein [Bacteroidaceae bacterium]
MNYKETIDYLFACAPLFQNIGKEAYKEGLETSYILDEHFRHPHTLFKTIHVAGTNGKGSCSHTLAAILQQAGYKVGLYTSPHLIDFRERIRINGEMISEEYVINFIEKEKDFFEPLHPSFFELTTALAFQYFATQQVDVGVIEVGLGGRLDCTNLITPEISIITNISFDHTQFLGNTLKAIAGEKAGIIKKKVPIIIGEANVETRPVFLSKALEMEAPITFAEDHPIVSASFTNYLRGGRTYTSFLYGEIDGELGGLCQQKNTNTLLTAIEVMKECGFRLTEECIRIGLATVCEKTGLMGRWQKIKSSPNVICDTGHNIGGWIYISEQLKHQFCRQMHIVFGMVNDKDITSVLKILPTDAIYYFTKANVKRALNENVIKKQANELGLKGEAYPTVEVAYEKALESAEKQDFIYVGGSSFVVADLLTFLH